MNVEVRPTQPRSRGDGRAFAVYVDGVERGRIETRCSANLALDVVSIVYVEQAFRRQGLATKLYEAAHAAACKSKRRLASVTRGFRSASNSFWEKQARLGRAISTRTRTGTRYVVLATEPCDLS